MALFSYTPLFWYNWFSTISLHYLNVYVKSQHVIGRLLVWFPWSACRSVLGQDTESQITPKVLVGTLHGINHHQCMNVCMNYCKLLWTKASAKCPKMWMMAKQLVKFFCIWKTEPQMPASFFLHFYQAHRFKLGKIDLWETWSGDLMSVWAYLWEVRQVKVGPGRKSVTVRLFCSSK